ncbi:hypothetical protein ACFLUG_03440 [Chloroflexota bacterium]
MAVASSVKTRFTHQEPGKDVIFGIAGRYMPLQESVLDYGGRKILYSIGQVFMESSCCDLPDWTYIVVPGYIVNLKNTLNQDGLAVSEVEPVKDRKAREELTAIIQATEGIIPVEFW